jgi:hypothetical protein
MKIEIKNRFNRSIILCGEYESIKDCLEKNRTADLSGADLSGANLKNYSESHDVFIQLVKEKLIKFTKQEQEIASRVFVLRLCWESIKKEYGKKMDSIFKKLSDLGHSEYLEKWKEVK